jgi:cyanophycinase
MIRAKDVVPLGSLVAVGGNEDKTADLEVLRTICALPEGGTKVVEIVPIASRVPEEAAGQYIEPFQKLGVETVNIMDVSSRAAANDAALVQRIIDADVVFFTGGDQLRITNLLGGSGLHRTLQGHYQRGGVVAGTSAGAAAMSQAMIYQGKAGQAMRKGTVQMTPGMGLLRNVVIDSHFTQRGRFSRLLEVVTGNPGVIGLGLDEDSGVVVRDGNRIEAIGSGVVVVIDGHEMRYSSITQVRMGRAIAVEGMLVHTLTKGHGFHLEDRRYLRPAVLETEEDHEDPPVE